MITVNRESVPATVLYARDRMREAHIGGYGYNEWKAAYAVGVDESRVKLIEGAGPFVPNQIIIEVVDLGANWNSENNLLGRDVQRAQPAQLAGFAVLYAASQDPEWVLQMDGKEVPYALAGALILNMPDEGLAKGVPGYGKWEQIPYIFLGWGAELTGSAVDSWYHKGAFPVIRYKR